MSGVVLDASTTLSWAFEDEDMGFADAVLDLVAEEFACVPALWAIEVANGLATGLRRGRLAPEEADAFCSSLAVLDVRVDEAPRDPLELTAVAVGSGISAYDAAYLLLAQRAGLPLATLDQRLASVAAEAGVTVLRPDEPGRRTRRR